MTGSELNYKTRAKDTGKLIQVQEYEVENKLNYKSYRWRSIRSWNQLPQDITSITSIQEFKFKLKAWVVENISTYP